MAWLAGFILKLFCWKVETDDITPLKKAVLVMAPHTSNWDFVIGRLALMSRRVSIKTMIKKEAFRFPLGYLLKALGGIPVDRSNSLRTVKSITSQFEKSDRLILLITPEGTRQLNKHWKKGFYFIAQAVDVPIILGFLCYKRKVAGLGPVIYPTDDYGFDLKRIESFYLDKTARYPEKFNLSPMYRL
ncbi:MAG TPA: 1-acyl-sn-glycerol-3-phosphate acyltransferase [Bacteroidales bacterium]|nr:1-acyl-sn-glycerol-3-phosphate acyltransferase [Bacteroidales bacterium]